MGGVLRVELALAVAVLAALGLLLVSCGDPPPHPQAAPSGGQEVSGDGLQAEAPLGIMVSILPQRYFVERIGGERVAVSVMVAPGASPETYEPKPDQMRALARARAYVRIGVPFETVWMDRISSANSNMMIIDSIRGIARLPMTASHSHEEEPEDHHPDEHEDERQVRQGEAPKHPDPHVWLSPGLVKIQARAIHEALVELDPSHQSLFREGLDRFLADIDRLDADIRSTLSGTKNRKFLVFHPAWGYFAHDYDLEMIPIEVEGREPSAAEMARLISLARQEGIKVVFAQPEFSTQKAGTIAREIGGEVVLISPLAHDWLANLQGVADTFSKVLGTR